MFKRGRLKLRREECYCQDELNNKILYQQNNKELSAVKHDRTQEI